MHVLGDEKLGFWFPGDPDFKNLIMIFISLYSSWKQFSLLEPLFRFFLAFKAAKKKENKPVRIIIVDTVYEYSESKKFWKLTMHLDDFIWSYNSKRKKKTSVLQKYREV